MKQKKLGGSYSKQYASVRLNHYLSDIPGGLWVFQKYSYRQDEDEEAELRAMLNMPAITEFWALSYDQTARPNQSSSIAKTE